MPAARTERPGLRAAYVAIGGELLLTLLAFVVAATFVANLPGLRPAVEWLAVRVFGPPTIDPAQFKIVAALLLAPLSTLLAAALHRGLVRLLPDDEPASPLPTSIPLLASVGQVLLHFLLAILGSYLLAVTMHLLGFPVAEQPLVVEITRNPWGPEIGVLAVSALLLAPLGEELLLRGQLFRRVAARTGLAPAYATTALVFAVIHWNPQGFIVYAWLALVFARVYTVTGRLGAAIAVHFGNNAITLAALLFAPDL